MIALTLIVFLASFAVLRIRYGYGAQRLERAVAERRRPRQDNYTAVLYRHGG
jgi:hypothetical protein